MINNTIIKQVSHTKFLGVIIDENLNWEKHITDLKRKLYYSLSTIKRIKDSIPEHLHKDLYYTLFESHLSYCLSVFGGISNSKIEKVQKVQKSVIRILFGDTEAFKDKFKTCARTRTAEEQKLGSSFYTKEHTKPLFEKHKILSIQNLYTFHTFMEVFKILKLQSPSCLYYQYQKSTRKYLTYVKLNPPNPSDHFIYRSSIIWNGVRHKLELNDLSISTCSVKNKLKELLFINQHKFHKLEWLPSHDYKFF